MVSPGFSFFMNAVGAHARRAAPHHRAEGLSRHASGDPLADGCGARAHGADGEGGGDVRDVVLRVGVGTRGGGARDGDDGGADDLLRGHAEARAGWDEHHGAAQAGEGGKRARAGAPRGGGVLPSRLEGALTHAWGVAAAVPAAARAAAFAAALAAVLVAMSPSARDRASNQIKVLFARSSRRTTPRCSAPAASSTRDASFPRSPRNVPLPTVNALDRPKTSDSLARLFCALARGALCTRSHGRDESCRAADGTLQRSDRPQAPSSRTADDANPRFWVPRGRSARFVFRHRRRFSPRTEYRGLVSPTRGSARAHTRVFYRL